jgi:hypothetical protein
MAGHRGTHQHRWTPEQIAWLRTYRLEHSIAETTDAFAERFGVRVSISAMHGACGRYDVTGRQGHFRPGHATWNRGLTGYRTSPATEFKPGNKPYNHRRVGEYRYVARYGWLLKVRETGAIGESRHDWVAVTRLTWMAHHGEIPAGHVVMILDGDPDNVLDIDNLACVSRGVLAYLNGKSDYANLPPDRALRRAAIAEATLRVTAHACARAAGLSAPEIRRALKRSRAA